MFKWSWTIFSLGAPDRLRAVSLFLLLAVYGKQWSVSSEYTKSLFLPHQKQWPARWDPNNEGRIIYNCQEALRIVFTKASAPSLQIIRSSFVTVFSVFAEKAVLWISALQMFGKNRNHLELPLGVRTNPVYKTSWASLPAKQTITAGSSAGFNVKLLHDWSNFDLPKLMPEKDICLMTASCLSLINTRQDTSQ